MSLNLFIIGPSGSGKSTQSKLVSEKYGLTPISLNLLINEEISSGSGFGDEVKSYTNNDKKVPDDLIFDILINKLKSIENKNFIVSGYPQSLNQGRLIEFYLRKQNSPCSLLISIDNTTPDICEFFKNKSKLLVIKSTQSEDKMFKSIVKVIENISK